MTISRNIQQKVVEVTDKAPSLKKTERNDDARFNFVGIDGFYEQIARLANDLGLNWATVEEGIELMPLADGQLVVAQKFRFDLFDSEFGDVAEGYSRLTIISPFSDAQTAGISLSYADKAFMRSAFKVVTGEKDADHMAKPRGRKVEAKPEPRQERPQEPKEARQAEEKAKPPPEKKAAQKPAKAAEAASPATEGAEAKAIVDSLISKLNEVTDTAGLDQFRIDEQGDLTRIKNLAAESEAAAAELDRVQALYREMYDKFEAAEAG